ncbi:transposase [Mesorhizobium sp.]|uniref:transposase n=1 Tax=Mesorhizobium sp. TaxID=1871066 RepID=UPI00257CFCC0|nr:transposase [Mesorhizobium sp.]
MRRQTRPFTVEIKQKRSSQRSTRSIWGDVDLSAAMAETTRELKEMELPNRHLVDSNVVALDAAHAHEPRAEHLMAAESEETATEPAVSVVTPDAKRKTQRSRKAKAEPRARARKNGPDTGSSTGEAPAAAVRTGRKVYSEKERAQKLDLIASSISGGATLKSAVKQAGISEQTYYHWKKAAAPSATSDELTDLLALENENKRLKSLLAERLRKENAELKRKLGLQ